MHPIVGGALVAAGSASTTALVLAVVDGLENSLAVTLILLIGPAWALAFCLASTDDDFAAVSRTRADYLRVLPWTFVLAPLVIPNVVILASFVRDSRADNGRTWLTWDRMRPGEADRDQHWPFSAGH